MRGAAPALASPWSLLHAATRLGRDPVCWGAATCRSLALLRVAFRQQMRAALVVVMLVTGMVPVIASLAPSGLSYTRSRPGRRTLGEPRREGAYDGRRRLLVGLDGSSGYHDNEQTHAWLKAFTSGRCGAISRMFSIGRSGRGRPLWVLELADHPGANEAEPNFKYVANMHGNEPLGRELLLRHAQWLCDQYVGNSQPDPLAKRMVEDMHVYMLLSMNPDGFAKRSRGNARGADLNRDFPDQWKSANGVYDLDLSGRQPETAALMRWTLATPFVASINFHEGALVANYPWDAAPREQTQAGYAAAPDDATFRRLARAYADHHVAMAASKRFRHGITNGNKWYPVYGGMQDWNYLVGKCMDITVEADDRKWPNADLLEQLFQDHRASMLHLPLLASFGGVRGTIEDATTGRPVPNASLVVTGTHTDGQLFSSPHTPHVGATYGDFYRPLALGSFTVTTTAPGYMPDTQSVQVPPGMDGPVITIRLRPETAKGVATAHYHQAADEASRARLSALAAAAAHASPAAPDDAPGRLPWPLSAPPVADSLQVRHSPGGAVAATSMHRLAVVWAAGPSAGMLGLMALYAMARRKRRRASDKAMRSIAIPQTS